jgi:ABC-type dipeptide/oligopeptide/nickel transport system ATPase subunit
MLIGFNGGMGAGKSTAIQLLGKIADREVRNVKFAQPIYDIQEYAYQRIASVYQRPANFVKDRKLLQWIGTEWGRDSISPDLWLSIWREEVLRLQHLNPDALIVCDDVRFDNEAMALRGLGGKIIRIVADRAQERTMAGIANHASEAGISAHYIDYLVENNGTVSDLNASLTYLYQRHLVPAAGEVDSRSA